MGGAARNLEERYVLRLFVAGNEPNSQSARENLAQLCQQHLKARCEVEIVDVLEDLDAALANNVLLTPTLLLVAPPPRVTVLGNLSDHQKVLQAIQSDGGRL